MGYDVGLPKLTILKPAALKILRHLATATSCWQAEPVSSSSQTHIPEISRAATRATAHHQLDAIAAAHEMEAETPLSNRPSRLSYDVKAPMFAGGLISIN